ncbi:MAG: hypothetical protein ABIG69_11895 [Bacteroidota bacterium]
MDSVQQYIDQALGLENEKPEDYWQMRSHAPLFTKKKKGDYSEPLTDDDMLSIPITKAGTDAQSRNPFNALVCASTGIGKDRMIKNLIKAFHKQGYKILHIEPKGFEMFNAYKKGKGSFFHPKDKNESLPIVGYMPNYIKSYIERDFPELLKKVKFYSHNIKNMDSVEIWQSFGVPIKMASFIVEMIEKGHTNLDYFIKRLPKSAKHYATKNAVDTALGSLKATNFFGSNKLFNLEKEWENNNVVDVMYMSRDGTLMNTDIGLIVDLVRSISIKESRKGLKLEHITKKLLIFNDAFMYAGMSAKMSTSISGNTNLAIRSIGNCQNNFRTWGIDTIFVAQSPDSNAIVSSLIDGCTTKFVSYTEKPQDLHGKIPLDAYFLLSNTDKTKPMLYHDEDNYIFQWIYVRGKTKWFTGFPVDCTLGHS